MTSIKIYQGKESGIYHAAQFSDFMSSNGWKYQDMTDVDDVHIIWRRKINPTPQEPKKNIPLTEVTYRRNGFRAPVLVKAVGPGAETIDKLIKQYANGEYQSYAAKKRQAKT